MSGSPLPQSQKSLQQIVMEVTESGLEVSTVTAGDLEVDLIGYQARFKGRGLVLSTSELEVLAILVATRRICPRTELSELLRFYGDRTVDMILTKVRQRVERSFIRNVHGVGWIVNASMLRD